MEKSPSITRLVSQDFIEKHATPSNIVYGKAIYNRDAVQVLESSDVRAEAWVGGLDGKVIEGGGSKRKVEFVALKSGLKWNCTGNPKDHQIFCKHCVALALYLIKRQKVAKRK
jgi:uncharacterized Zn finger protein